MAHTPELDVGVRSVLLCNRWATLIQDKHVATDHRYRVPLQCECTQESANGCSTRRVCGMAQSLLEPRAGKHRGGNND